MDFECPCCGNKSEVCEVADLEQDGDILYAFYLHKCPKCGQRFRLTEVYCWDGITQVDKI